MIYDIRETNGRFNLLLSKKNGMKFKKSFTDQNTANWFIAAYLRMCCLECKEKGLSYKTRGTGGMCGGINRRTGKSGLASAGSVVVCPECRTNYLVEYVNREVQGWVYDNKGRHPYTAIAIDLVLKSIADYTTEST